MKGRFIAFEGIDGCGKTTQINCIANWLAKSGLMPRNSKLLISKEPGGTPLGISLRKLLLNPPGNEAPESLTELLLYTADRAQHISQVILPAINKGDWIISDRFSGSTIAYQGYGRKLNLNVIKQLEEIATQGTIPDMTLWLDIPISESLKRREKTTNDRIESEGAEFLSRVSLGFESLAKERGWCRINANDKAEIISEKIKIEITRSII